MYIKIAFSSASFVVFIKAKRKVCEAKKCPVLLNIVKELLKVQNDFAHMTFS